MGGQETDINVTVQVLNKPEMLNIARRLMKLSAMFGPPNVCVRASCQTSTQ